MVIWMVKETLCIIVYFPQIQKGKEAEVSLKSATFISITTPSNRNRSSEGGRKTESTSVVNERVQCSGSSNWRRRHMEYTQCGEIYLALVIFFTAVLFKSLRCESCFSWPPDLNWQPTNMCVSHWKAWTNFPYFHVNTNCICLVHNMCGQCSHET